MDNKTQGTFHPFIGRKPELYAGIALLGGLIFSHLTPIGLAFYAASIFYGAVWLYRKVRRGGLKGENQ